MLRHQGSAHAQSARNHPSRQLEAPNGNEQEANCSISRILGASSDDCHFTIFIQSGTFIPRKSQSPKVPGGGTLLCNYWLSRSYLFSLFLYRTGTFGTLGLSDFLAEKGHALIGHRKLAYLSDLHSVAALKAQRQPWSQIRKYALQYQNVVPKIR